MPMEIVFIIGMAVLLFLCLKVKANAFISLLATALVMGLLSGMTGADTIGAITGGFSGTVKSIGIIIIFGIMLGNYLDAAKGTNRMALDAVRLVGQKRAGLAMAITGYIVSIPVFFRCSLCHPDAACKGNPQKDQDTSGNPGSQSIRRPAGNPCLCPANTRPSGSGRASWD